jgi:dCTP deaminase
MILTGQRIEEAVTAGDITIDPFDPRQLNPNSYNYRLGPELRTLAAAVADPRDAASLRDVPCDGEGAWLLEPNKVYLGTTEERIGSSTYVPSLIGRSSLGRLGVFLQISADLGQLGAVHRWTLEIVATQPIRLYAGMKVGQVSFWRPTGRHMDYHGFYGGHSEPLGWDPGAVVGAGDGQGQA